ncbi:hypothetical protein SESBI_07910 [Sesbania bispinosa]|nr:hypothetical protein SESBI_07910 [Sesbania bispinosa]
MEEALSSEEKDNLDRSTKKAKVEEANPPRLKVEVSNYSASTEMEETRRVVSYKDAILGVNGGDQSDSSSEDEGSFCTEMSEEDSSKDSDNDEEAIDSSIDPLCLEVHISDHEYKQACKQWKLSVIVKLLGKRVSLRFL